MAREQLLPPILLEHPKKGREGREAGRREGRREGEKKEKKDVS